MPSRLHADLSHQASLRVGREMTVPQLSKALAPFADMPPVLATAMMIGFVESTCIACLDRRLGPEEHTVGTHIDISHCAPTPAGMTVTAEVTLTEVTGRKLSFDVTVRDEGGIIAEGTHERAVITVERFMANATERARRALGTNVA